MYEVIKALPYFIPIIIIAYFSGIICGFKLAGWALKNSRVGRSKLKEMESE